MKYKKSEAKEAARSILKGIWTAMPYSWDEKDEFDEAANRANMEHIISGLHIDGHYCSGNIAEFWSMPDAERMRAHEVMHDQARGRIPLIAGCHHQSVKQATALAKHAQDVGFDFVIVLTPFVAAKDDDAVYSYYEYICERVDIGVILFNTPPHLHAVGPKLAKRLAALPNVCAYKQGDSNPAATSAILDAVGDQLTVSVADEAPWLQSMTQYGLQWLVNYNPHLYQVPGYLPIREYTQAAMAGDLKKAAEISRSLNPLRALHAKWINGYWRAGRMPLGEMKVWQEIIGMKGGPVRPPVLPVSDKARAEMEADLAAVGLLEHVRTTRIAAE
jgi:4-hydroxy-tetrahydrodipicolinate synthase